MNSEDSKCMAMSLIIEPSHYCGVGVGRKKRERMEGMDKKGGERR